MAEDFTLLDSSCVGSYGFLMNDCAYRSFLDVCLRAFSVKLRSVQKLGCQRSPGKRLINSLAGLPWTAHQTRQTPASGLGIRMEEAFGWCNSDLKLREG